MAIAKSSKVLLMEDDATMQGVLRTLLEIEGFQVIIAPDREQQADIIRFIRMERPDVLLLDVHMREINGLDILRSLRQLPEMAGARVVMTSGMDIKERCLEAGADGFLLKPFMPDELINQLRGEKAPG